ncbi:MAG: alanyl-tRNA editing protein [Solobacterium sp.]|nr:alanyl-tRNA editing protein [Solobacterium sp.]
MKTRKLYEEDAYLKSFSARVLECSAGKKGYEVILDETAFYPEGGGQPSDRGTLNGIPVKDVRTKNGEIVHMTAEPLAAGETVQGVIDFDRRFDLMQNHSGEHMVSGIIHNLFGYDNVGFHMGDVIQIDFNGSLTWEDCRKVERLANEAVQRNMEVHIDYPDQETLDQLDYRSKKELEGDIRIVSVDGIDICACCGTHVRKTGEIGIIKLLSAEKHKQGVRIEMVSGKRAYEYLAMVYDDNHEAGTLLSKPAGQSAEGIRHLQEVIREKDSALRELSDRYFDLYMDTVEAGKDLLILMEKNLQKNAVQRLVNRCVEEKHPGTCAVFNETGENRFTYFIVSRTQNLREKGKELNARLRGKGGGSAEMIQGSLNASAEEIREAVKEIL